MRGEEGVRLNQRILASMPPPVLEKLSALGGQKANGPCVTVPRARPLGGPQTFTWR